MCDVLACAYWLWHRVLVGAMTVLDPYNLLPQGVGLLAWNTNISKLMRVGERFGDQGMLLEVTEATGILNFSTGPAQRVSVRLVRGAV